MSLTMSPAKSRYLERVRAALGDLTEEDRDEVIQDLEAHLAELNDTELERVLGSPEAFVAEFRASAGLETSRRGKLSGASDRLQTWEERIRTSPGWARLAETWVLLRPVWIWTRGWLGVTLFNNFTAYGAETFRHFPIPTIGQSSSKGLLAVAAATLLSVVLARYPLKSPWGLLSAIYTTVVGLMLATSLLNPASLVTTNGSIEEIAPQGLTVDGWEQVRNIYAFDTEGNPVEVLLYDQDGRPLLNFPSYTYENAEYEPQLERYSTDFGQVRFHRDQYGRIIPNLYPLDTWEYSDYGELTQTRPPRLGVPEPGTGSGGEAGDQVLPE